MHLSSRSLSDNIVTIWNMEIGTICNNERGLLQRQTTLCKGLGAGSRKPFIYENTYIETLSSSSTQFSDTVKNLLCHHFRQGLGLQMNLIARYFDRIDPFHGLDHVQDLTVIQNFFHVNESVILTTYRLLLTLYFYSTNALTLFLFFHFFLTILAMCCDIHLLFFFFKNDLT